MTYEWEAQVTRLAMERAQKALPGNSGLKVIGLAVAHVENGEGALILHPEAQSGDIWAADVLKDVCGGAKSHYEQAAHAAFVDFERIQSEKEG